MITLREWLSNFAWGYSSDYTSGNAHLAEILQTYTLGLKPDLNFWLSYIWLCSNIILYVKSENVKDGTINGIDVVFLKYKACFWQVLGQFNILM